jgi:hypothetical protein
MGRRMQLLAAMVLYMGMLALLPVWTDQAAEARAAFDQAWGDAQAYAQEVPVPPAPSVQVSASAPAAPNWAMVWVPIVATMVTAIFKLLLPSIPKPAIPFLCILLGAIVDAINAWTTGGSVNPVTMLIMGPIGIGLREMYDQAKKSMVVTG